MRLLHPFPKVSHLFIGEKRGFAQIIHCQKAIASACGVSAEAGLASLEENNDCAMWLSGRLLIKLYEFATQGEITAAEVGGSLPSLGHSGLLFRRMSAFSLLYAVILSPQYSDG
jgi:hypothetical protein